LDTLKAGARPEQIAAAQAALDQANAGVARLQEGSRKGDVTAAQANVQAAQAALARLYQGADENVKIAARADLANAEAGLRNAQAAYDKVKDQPNVAMLPQSLQLEQASNSYEAAKARWEELNAPPKSDQVAQASAAVKQAQAGLDKASDPSTAAELAGAEAAVRQARAQLDLLKAGARDQEIAAADAAVTQAEAGLRQAQAALSDTELRAPFAGTLAVLNVRQGEQVTPGVPVAEVGDLSGLQVETDDLSELDVVRVQPGQEVRLTFDAIPGLELKGTVERVQPKGEKKLGDMTYTAVIRLQNPDSRLLWNMTAVMNVP
jgi:multidrug resistance efflux pump